MSDRLLDVIREAGSVAPVVAGARGEACARAMQAAERAHLPRGWMRKGTLAALVAALMLPAGLVAVRSTAPAHRTTSAPASPSRARINTRALVIGSANTPTAASRREPSGEMTRRNHGTLMRRQPMRIHAGRGRHEAARGPQGKRSKQRTVHRARDRRIHRSRGKSV